MSASDQGIFKISNMGCEPTLGGPFPFPPSPPFSSLFPPNPYLPLLFPSVPHPFPSPPFLSLPSPLLLPLSFPSLSTRSTPLPLISYPFLGPFNPARMSGGALWAPPAESGEEPQPKLNLVHFSLKIWHLVARNLMIFLRIKWLNFMQALVETTEYTVIMCL